MSSYATHYLVIEPCTANQTTRAFHGPRAYQESLDAALAHLESGYGRTAKIQSQGLTVWDSEAMIDRTMTSLEWSEILTMINDHSDMHNPTSKLRCLAIRIRERAIAAADGRSMP
jgi:hypothetical protein